MRIDTMIERGIIPPPNLIKIDTDGLEIPIVKGMKELLCSKDRPRSILVEVERGQLDEQLAFLTECGYEMTGHWLPQQAKLQFEAGKPLQELPHNAIFSRAA
jgi:hypothetical protein